MGRNLYFGVAISPYRVDLCNALHDRFGFGIFHMRLPYDSDCFDIDDIRSRCHFEDTILPSRRIGGRFLIKGLEKILRGRVIKLYDEDQDLLEDVLIEIKQAVDMAAIHLNILTNTMDVFASIISNNLNIVMKIQASLTLLVSVPTVISGFYGMNIIGGLPFDRFWWFPIALSGVLMLVMYIILKSKDMF